MKQTRHFPLGAGFGALAAAMALLAPVHAATVAAHSGNANPLTEGWSRFPGDGSSSEGPVDDAGTPAWSISDSSTAGGSYLWYYETLPAAQDTLASSRGWTLDATLRVTAPGAAPLGSTFIGFGTGHTQYGLLIAASAAGDMTLTAIDEGAGRDDWPSATIVGGATGYHDYRLVYDPASTSVDVFFDGALRISDWTSGPTNFLVGPQWGMGASGYTGEADFASLRVAVVPEPGTLALMLAALAGMMGASRARRRSA